MKIPGSKSDNQSFNVQLVASNNYNILQADKEAYTIHCLPGRFG